jgi:hypothetical protein
MFSATSTHFALPLHVGGLSAAIKQGQQYNHIIRIDLLPYQNAPTQLPDLGIECDFMNMLP